MTFAGYFLITSRQGSAIPTYFLALTGLVGMFFSPIHVLKQIYVSRTLRVLVFFLLYLVLSLTWYEGSGDTTGVLKSVLIDAIVLFFACVAFLHVKRDIDLTKLAIVLVLLGASIAALVLLLIEILKLPLTYTGAWNVWGVAAIAFGFAFLVSVTCALRYRATWEGILFSTVALLCFGVIVLINSPIVYFGLLAALVSLSFAALWEARFQRQSLFWVFLSGVLMILSLQVFNELMEEKRSAIWASTLDSLFDGKLIVGAGYPTISAPITNCVDAEAFASINGSCVFDHPHNMFVSTIYQLGLSGFLILFVLYLVALGGLFESRIEHRWLLGGSLVYAGAVFLFEGQMLVSNMNYVWLIFWLPIFLIVREESRLSSFG